MPILLAIAIILVLIIIWLITIVGMVLVMYGALTTKVPFVPVSSFVAEALVKEVPLRRGDVFYDLGSGDGRVVIALARANPYASAIGVDKAPLPYLLSQFHAWRSGLRNVKFRFKNFSKINLTSATHIYMYLLPELVQKLLPRFEKELRPGTEVILCDFPFEAKVPYRTAKIAKEAKSYTLYFYKF